MHLSRVDHFIRAFVSVSAVIVVTLLSFENASAQRVSFCIAGWPCEDSNPVKPTMNTITTSTHTYDSSEPAIPDLPSTQEYFLKETTSCSAEKTYGGLIGTKYFAWNFTALFNKKEGGVHKASIVGYYSRSRQAALQLCERNRELVEKIYQSQKK